MIKLPHEFDSRGFHHRQIKRAGNVAIFERFHKSTPERVHFEVVEIQQDQDRDIHGSMVPAHERMPSAETWGRFGFTYLPEDRAGAERRFAEMSALGD